MKELQRGYAMAKEENLLSPDHIADAVCRFYEVDADKMYSGDRKRKTVFARHAAIYLVRKYTTLSFPKIGEIFNRDHSTAQYAFKNISRAADPNLINEINQIEEMLW